MDRPIGHDCFGGEVRAVYADSCGPYQLLDDGDEDGPRRQTGHWLGAGQDWSSRGVKGQLDANRRPVMMRRAVHEAGHAIICLDEGIKIEFVTIAVGQGRLGYCQYDYGLKHALKADLRAWGWKVARATLGGMEAEKLHLEQIGSVAEPEHPWAWSQDLSDVQGWLEDLLELQVAGVPDAEGELARLQSSVRARLQLPELWSAVQEIANRLLVELAISGSMANQIVLACRSRHERANGAVEETFRG